MLGMSVCCPHCGSRFLNYAKTRSLKEQLEALLGNRPLRCGDCRTRFVARTYVWQDSLAAKCPCCYRMDLNRWHEKHLRPRGWMAVLLALGGVRLRCEYCRINFVSMRRRKYYFTFNRWTRYKTRRTDRSI